MSNVNPDMFASLTVRELRACIKTNAYIAETAEWPALRERAAICRDIGQAELRERDCLKGARHA